ncbi:MAG: NAD(P)/FAD-dependent oxidoreductase, partial [Firmicutes bacterium]|nr:NAD(P)/FAD-dependent oxidoreductase [Bacillota bacterium]
DLRFRITGTRGWKTAQVTCGGVPLSEVDQKTFGSLFCPGLFITGELLDYDGPCGGFNIDWALHTGITAGRAV